MNSAEANPNENQREQDRKEYLQELKQGLSYSIRKFDDQILYIASGTLVLSLNFLKDVVPLKATQFKWMLIASWGTLILTIIFSLVLHLISYHRFQKQIDRLENNKDLPDDKFMPKANWIMAGLLVASLIFQALFVSLNIKNIPMSKNEKRSGPVREQTHNPGKGNITENGMPVGRAPKSIQPGDQRGMPVSKPPQSIKSQGTDSGKSGGDSKK